jgi:hypothetical protein
MTLCQGGKMPEEEQTTVNEENTAETQDTPVDSAETPTEPEGDGLLGIKEEEEPKKKDDGLDPELYDTQTKKLREDKAIEKLNSFKEEKAKYEKQIKDLRRIVSKGKAPEDTAEYASYKPDSKFEKYYDFENEANEGVKSVLDKIDNASKEAGFNVEQNKIVKDIINDVMADAGIFDTRTEEQVKLEREDWKNEQLKKLGDDAQHILKEVPNFINNNNIFNEEEKQSILKAADKDASVVSGLYKLKKLIRGVGQVPIPNAETTGLADDYALAEEYNDPKTLQSRRVEIIKQRMQAGRTGGLPVLKR